jgi:hypothetical protein
MKTMIVGCPDTVKKRLLQPETGGCDIAFTYFSSFSSQNGNRTRTGYGTTMIRNSTRAVGAEARATLHRAHPFRGSETSRRTRTGTEPSESTRCPFPFCSHFSADAPETLPALDWDRGHEPDVAQKPRVLLRLDLHHVEQRYERERAPTREITMLTEPWNASRGHR